MYKTILTCREAAQYLGISLSQLYKLTMRRVIPHSKPLGKLVYFKKVELDDFMMSNRVETAQTLEAQAQRYLKGDRRSFQRPTRKEARL